MKFFNETCTIEEEQVLKWLASEDGQVYLARKPDEDEALRRDECVKPMLSGISSKRIWNNNIENAPGVAERRKMSFYLCKNPFLN